MLESMEKTNEEKARKICCSGCENYNCYTKKEICDTLKMLLIMAEWKDEQFKSMIDKIKANIIESRDSKDYRPTTREVTLSWVLRLIDEIMEE